MTSTKRAAMFYVASVSMATSSPSGSISATVASTYSGSSCSSCSSCLVPFMLFVWLAGLALPGNVSSSKKHVTLWKPKGQADCKKILEGLVW